MSDITYTTEDGITATLHDGPLTCGEIDEIIRSDERLHGVFRVPLTPLMENDYDEASDWMIDQCVLGGAPYELEDWSYEVVGAEPGNILHMFVDGWLVDTDY